MSVTATTQQLVHKTAAVRPENQGGTRYRWIISDGSVDRQGDTINPMGWDLRSYSQNPVVLWAHDYKALPLGKSRSTYVSQGKLIAEMEFAPPGLYPLADQVRGLIDAGILVGASIGMKPIEAIYNAKRDGTDFLKQELLEWSIVSIPANSNAIRQRCVGGRCDEKAIRKWLGVEAAIPPVPTWRDDSDVVTFELEDLKTAIVETLKREVKTRLSGLVD